MVSKNPLMEEKGRDVWIFAEINSGTGDRNSKHSRRSRSSNKAVNI